MPRTTSPATAPILPGFHPDPSICRVGDAFYLVTSTFEYLPGVPVFASTDLVAWEPVGHAYHRPEQLDLSEAGSSGGLFAATIRHHDGTFYVATTDIARAGVGQLLTHATDPAGPWSVPVIVEGAGGIDPDLFWDVDGTCHVSWTGGADTGERGILSVPIDPRTGERLGLVRALWAGSGLAHPEGPHLYRRGDWYYCLLAEGGTERGHGVTIARSRSLDGPWEPHPANPFLSHRSTTHPVQNVGHADLVELADGADGGTWAMVHLGVRPRGRTPGFHVNGRESFAVGIEWTDDWPWVSEVRYEATPSSAFVDTFDAPEPNHRWISAGGAHRSLTRGGDHGLEVAPSESEGTPSIAVRARDTDWRATVALGDGAGDPALVLHLATDAWAELLVHDGVARLTLSSLGLRHDLGTVDLDGVAPDALVVTARSYPPSDFPGAGPDVVTFAVHTAAGEHVVGSFDGRHLATEVAGGFTGRVIGVRASGAPVTVTRFGYEPLEPPTA